MTRTTISARSTSAEPSSSPASPSSGSLDPPSRASILLVDDQPARLLTYEAVLSNLDVRCVRALSGREALRHLLEEEFAVILLDVQMPEINGFDLAHMIREHPRLERTPIIFVTGVHMSELDRLKGYEVGAIDYIAVPVVPEILRSKVAVLVELHLKRRELQGLNRQLEQMRLRVEQEHERLMSQKDSEISAERLRAEAALRASDRYNDALVENAPVAICHCALDGRFERVNHAFRQLVGYSAEELLELRWQDITHPEDVDSDSTLAAQVIDGAIPHYTMQKRYVRKDGAVVWVSLFGNFLRDESGRAIQGVAIAIDVTEQRRAMQDLRESREALMLAKTGARLGIFDWDFSTGAVTWDDRLRELWGISAAEPIDHVTFVQGIHPEDRDGTLRSVDRAMHPHGDGRFACVHRVVSRRDQSLRWVEANGKVSFENGRPVRFNGIVQDITERKDAEARLQLIGDQLPLFISYVGADERYQSCNAYYSQWFGESREALLGKHVRTVVGDQTYARHQPFIERALRGETVKFEAPVPHRSLGQRDCEIVYLPHVQGAGHVHGFYVMAQDITERKQSEQRLRESEQRFRNMADHSPVIIWVTERDASCSYLNRRWYEFTGQAPDAEGPFDWLEPVHEDDRSRVLDQFMAANAAQVAFRLEYRLRNGHGHYHWVIDAATPRLSAAGEFAGYIGSIIDISERKLTEEILRDSEKRFRELADAMPQIVFTARPDGVTDYFNRKWYELTGLPGSSTDDQVWTSCVHPDDQQRTLKTWYDCVRSGTPYEIEYRFFFPQHGEYRWHLGRALPVRNAAGDIVRWYGTCTDVHELRLAQEALRQNDRRKDEFLATLAHELRNPLAPIRSAVQFLQLQSPADPRLDHARAIIDRQTQAMVRLVDDLLDLSRITRGRITLHKEVLSVEHILTSALDVARPLIDTHRHELVVSVPSEPTLISGDATRLAQVFSNLINNAAKYTLPGGRIEVRAECLGNEAIVSIRDNGIGIPPEMLTAVFDMFTQVDSALDRAQGGLGIGLTLARQLVTLHEGRIEARSKGVGHGSEFIVSLPIVAPSHERNASPGSQRDVDASPARRILIADDNVDAAKMLSLLLDCDGHHVRTARDGSEALKLFAEFRPDVVILDIGMPGLTGYEVASRIRMLPNASAVQLIAVSGWGQENDRRAAFAAGFDQHLTKPVDLKSLQAVLLQARH